MAPTDLWPLLEKLKSPAIIDVQNVQNEAIRLMDSPRYAEVWAFLIKQYKISTERQSINDPSSHVLLYNLKTLIANIMRRETARLLDDPEYTFDDLTPALEIFNVVRLRHIQRVNRMGVLTKGNPLP